MYALILRREFLREFAVGVVEIPIPGFGHDQALGGLQSERVHVGNERQQSREVLAALGDAELRCLLDRIDRVGPRIGEPDDLGL